MNLFFTLLIICGSLGLLCVAADLIVYSLSAYARKIGVSHYLIGFIVLAIGTGLPELIASIEGTFYGSGELVIGTIVGSNLFKIPMMGATIFFASGVSMKGHKESSGAPIIILLISLLPFILLIDGSLSRIDGFILIISFLFYVGNLWQKEAKLGKIKKSVYLKNIYKEGIIFTIALGVLLLSAQWLVDSSLDLSTIAHIPAFLIGIVVIGIGASAPEIMIQIKSIINKRGDLAFGNIFGSIVVNSSLVLGVVALIKPFIIARHFIIVGGIFTLICVLFGIIVAGKENVKKWHGIALMGLYALYLVMQFTIG